MNKSCNHLYEVGDKVSAEMTRGAVPSLGGPQHEKSQVEFLGGALHCSFYSFQEAEAPSK